MGERLAGFPRELRHRAAVKVWERLLRNLNLEFSEESRQNLLAANQLLKQNSVVFYINHKSLKKDAALSVSMVLAFLTNAKQIIGPAAMGRYDPSRDLKNAILLRALRPLGIQILPIARPEEIDKLDATRYSEEEKKQMRTDLRIATEEAVRNPGTVFGIAPEGTSKSLDGALLPARNGIGYLEAFDPDDNLVYLPVAYDYGISSGHPKIQVGKPLSLREMNLEKSMLPEDSKERAQFLTTVHMKRLADMLPAEMRGVYKS